MNTENLLHPTPISTRLLSYTEAENLLAGEDSDLPRPSQVYRDAIDVGYTLVSHRTGREIVYAQDGLERDAEGDILYWEYTPVTKRSEPRLPKLRIYND